MKDYEDGDLRIGLSRVEALRLRHALHLAKRSPELDDEQRDDLDRISGRILRASDDAALSRDGG